MDCSDDKEQAHDSDASNHHYSELRRICDESAHENSSITTAIRNILLHFPTEAGRVVYELAQEDVRLAAQRLEDGLNGKNGRIEFEADTSFTYVYTKTVPPFMNHILSAFFDGDSKLSLFNHGIRFHRKFTMYMVAAFTQSTAVAPLLQDKVSLSVKSGGGGVVQLIRVFNHMGIAKSPSSVFRQNPRLKAQFHDVYRFMVRLCTLLGIWILMIFDNVDMLRLAMSSIHIMACLLYWCTPSQLPDIPFGKVVEIAAGRSGVTLTDKEVASLKATIAKSGSAFTRRRIGDQTVDDILSPTQESLNKTSQRAREYQTKTTDRLKNHRHVDDVRALVSTYIDIIELNSCERDKKKYCIRGRPKKTLNHSETDTPQTKRGAVVNDHVKTNTDVSKRYLSECSAMKNELDDCKDEDTSFNDSPPVIVAEEYRPNQSYKDSFEGNEVQRYVEAISVLDAH